MGAANSISASAAKRYDAVPVSFVDDKTLLVAMVDPSNVLAVDDIAIMTGMEVRALIQACSARAPTGIRNRALIVVMYRGGLRLGEALALYPKDLDAKAGTVTVLHGKGDRRHPAGLIRHRSEKSLAQA